MARVDRITQGTGCLSAIDALPVTDQDPLAIRLEATVAEVADAIHHDLAESFHAARIWGPSARFDGQQVGRGHVVSDLDVVEILH